MKYITLLLLLIAAPSWSATDPAVASFQQLAIDVGTYGGALLGVSLVTFGGRWLIRYFRG